MMLSKDFESLIRKILKAYIDGIRVKYDDFEDHIRSLRVVFKRLKRYKVKLNPKKCTFSIRLKMFLGHVVGRKGIEALPM